MLTLLSFLGTIMIIVSVHEYGHYLAARLFKVRVLRFSVGFGKPLWSRRDAKGTEWVIAPIPLGGYVSMLDREFAAANNFPMEETVESKSNWQRIIIYAAGPFANLVLSAFIFFLVLSGGQFGLRPHIGDTVAGSAAAHAGVQAGDIVAEVNGNTTKTWRDTQLEMVDALLDESPFVLKMESGTTYQLPANSATADALNTGVSEALGIYPYNDFILSKVAQLVPDSAAAIAGVAVGDDIAAINGVVVNKWRDAYDEIQKNPGKAVELILWRDGAGVTLTATLATTEVNRRTVGRLGVAPTIDKDKLAEELVTVHYSPLKRVVVAIEQTLNDGRRILGAIGLLLSGNLSTDNLSGPVGIAVQSGKAAEGGFIAWLGFLTVISTSLAVFNLLPLPVLDGGQILLGMVQCVVRREIPKIFLRWWNMLGFFLVFILLTFAVTNDILQML